MERSDIVVVGAGAAGLMAALWAARTANVRRTLVLDGTSSLGAKILVSGGGRCNVTHEAVRAEDFNGSTRPAIRKILARFDVRRTIDFFAELGVALKREETGKLFPVGDDARMVLRGLLDAVRDAGAVVRYPCRVRGITRSGSLLRVSGDWGAIDARRVILAPGGKSLPKTGSDGGGYALAEALGHTVTPHVFPALVPLVLPDGHPLRTLAGVSTPVTLAAQTVAGKRVAACSGSLLCTHFGISGPVVLDVSRHLHAARLECGDARLGCDWLPDIGTDALDGMLRAAGGGTIIGRMRGLLPERLARVLIEQAGVVPAAEASRLTREDRKNVVACLKATTLPVTRDRGWTYAEVTAGGIPLAQLNLATLESRKCPGLHVCGEICDVDGRIGGFNFQWAWASGYVAGVSAAEALPA